VADQNDGLTFVLGTVPLNDNREKPDQRIRRVCRGGFGIERGQPTAWKIDCQT
jgi:hypothetical protein